MEDPIDDSEAYRNWSLYYCENLTEQLKGRPCAGDPCTVEELVSPSLGAICQNTVAGEQLLELRKWKCAEFATPECICDGKKGRRFDNKQAVNAALGGNWVGRDGIASTPCRISE